MRALICDGVDLCSRCVRGVLASIRVSTSVVTEGLSSYVYKGRCAWRFIVDSKPWEFTERWLVYSMEWY